MYSTKILDQINLIKVTNELHSNQKKIVLANGCFDIFHIAHGDYLRRAKEYGDVLIVGVNSDESVKLLKGPMRPVFNERERATLISFLNFVDYVYIFPEINTVNLINTVKPHFVIKGTVETANSLELEAIEKIKGVFGQVGSYNKEYSSTKLVNKL